MELSTPVHLGGTYDVTAVSVGRDPDSATVRDCPVCGGHAFDDEWHLRATVRDGASSTSGARLDRRESLESERGAERPANGETRPASRDRETYVFCGPDCFHAWLRGFPAT